MLASCRSLPAGLESFLSRLKHALRVTTMAMSTPTRISETRIATPIPTPSPTLESFALAAGVCGAPPPEVELDEVVLVVGAGEPVVVVVVGGGEGEGGGAFGSVQGHAGIEMAGETKLTARLR
eukprot:Amastigsp_a841513_98.p5 type:complete len:123 gc:universal Amastigsp_a841513_98:34-402(+)